jgi:hypothetical protein
MILGYPPIPHTREPILIAARAEINAQADLHSAPHVHFVLSAMPRGGFSGGLVMLEYEVALGMVTRSLGMDHGMAELGYMTAISVEPIYVCLAEHKLLPDLQAAQWEDFWNKDGVGYVIPTNERNVFDRVAEVSVFDDGKRRYVEIDCVGDPSLLDRAVAEVERTLAACAPTRVAVRPGVKRVDADARCATADLVNRAAAAALAVFDDAGLFRSQWGASPAFARLQPARVGRDLPHDKSAGYTTIRSGNAPLPVPDGDLEG